MQRRSRAVPARPVRAAPLLRLGMRGYVVYRAVLELTRWGIGARRLRRETRSVPAVAGTGSLRLEVRTTGPREDGLPPVVLLEGYAVGNAYLLPLAGVLAKRLAVHAPDLPGHGHSDHDARPLTLREQAGVLEDWMRGSGLAGAVIVGHSTGCQIAAELTRAAPELVSGLVLVGPTSDARARSVPRQLARGLAGSTVDGPTYLLWSLTDYVRAGPAVLRAEMRQMIDHHIEDVLPGIGVPVRVVRGGFDLIVQPAWARTVAAIARAPADVGSALGPRGPLRQPAPRRPGRPRAGRRARAERSALTDTACRRGGAESDATSGIPARGRRCTRPAWRRVKVVAAARGWSR